MIISNFLSLRERIKARGEINGIPLICSGAALFSG
jgi:hypothetical protein